MKNLGRLDVIRLVAFSMLLILPATLGAQTRPPILDQIAKTYGIDSWDQIQAIRYTWNGEIPGLFKVAHKWEWEPKTGKISYESTDKEGKPVKVSYDSSQLSSQSDQAKNEVEPSFVNDNYWVLFPFHAYWDKSATVTDEGTKKLPVGSGSAELIVVKYPAEAGGYTPGDTWDLYVGKDNRVEYLVYHRGGAKKPSLVFATLDWLQKGRPSSVLNRAPRHRRWQTPAHLPFWRGSQGDGIRCVDRGEIRGLIRTVDVVRWASDYLAITTVVQELLSFGKSRFAAMRILSRGHSPRMIGQ